MADEGEQPPNIQTDQAPGDTTVRGAVVQPVYTERRVMHYGISDSELNTLGLYNALVAAFFGVAMFLVGLALSIWIEVGTQAETTATGEVLEDWAAPILVAFAVFFALLACLVWKVSGSTLTKIKEQSRPHKERES